MKARIQDGVVHSPYPGVDIPVRSFYSLVKEMLQINPQKVALADNVTSLTRSELLGRLQRYAVGFRRHGVLPGDRVCIHLNDSVENMVAMYGCVLAGATIVMAKTSLMEHDLRYQAENSDSTHILTEVEWTEKVSKATASLKMKGFFSMAPANGFVSAASFLSLDEQEFQECPVEDPKSTVMAVYYTSGSTGTPKGVEITHYNFVSCFYTLREQLPLTEGETTFSAGPITHISALVFSTMPVLNGPSSVVLPAKSTTVQVMDAIDKYKATLLVLFPSQLQALLREMHRMGRQLPTVRHICCGGSGVPAGLGDAARSTFGGLRTLQTMYGLTEACMVVAAQPKDLDISQHGSDIGFPSATVSFKVVDIETRQPLGPHQIGEICFCSATMARGYYKRPEETAELFDEAGFMKSGDAGYYDNDGRLYFAERLKQMIKCMENQVVPGELEELLLRNHGDEIAAVCVVGLPHVDYGESAAAAVVLSDKGRQQCRTDLAERITGTVKGNLPVHKNLHGGVFFLESLPKTDSAKVDRRALVRLILRAK
ncbi:uncharacterized protein LOC144173483 [Haemaphysalis longicornis]